MDKSLPDVLQPDRFKRWLTSALSQAGVTSVELLKDDRRVQQIATYLYDRIPLFPYRAAIKATMGQEGFTSFVFRIRDSMLRSGSMDLDWLDRERLKALLHPKRKQTQLPRSDPSH